MKRAALPSHAAPAVAPGHPPVCPAAVPTAHDEAVRARFLAVSRHYLFEIRLACDECGRVCMVSESTQPGPQR